jgi:hypothetical protein
MEGEIVSRRCERPGCTNGQAEVSKINGIIRMMCFDCTKEMVIADRDRKAEGGMFR